MSVLNDPRWFGLIRRLDRADELIRRETAKRVRWEAELETRRTMTPEWMRGRAARAIINIRRLERARQTLHNAMTRLRLAYERNCSAYRSGVRCTSGSEVQLIDPDGNRLPGGPHCMRHADEVISEYREKLGEVWTKGLL